MGATPSDAGAKRRKKPAEDRGPNQDAEVWWRKVRTGVFYCQLTQNLPTMEWLASESPDIFEASHSEAQAPGVPPGEHKKTACEVCGELANARGWGNPACYVCAGVDSHCLPIS